MFETAHKLRVRAGTARLALAEGIFLVKADSAQQSSFIALFTVISVARCCFYSLSIWYAVKVLALHTLLPQPDPCSVIIKMKPVFMILCNANQITPHYIYNET